MSPFAAAMLTLLTPHRWWPDRAERVASIRPERLSEHILRDIGLADGRERIAPRGLNDRETF